MFVLKIKRVTSSLNPRLTRPPFPLLWSGTLVSRLLPPTCFRAPVCSLYSSVTHADAGSSYSLCSALFSSIYRSPLFSLSPLACHLLLEQLCGPRPSIVCSPSFRLGFSYSGFSLSGVRGSVVQKRAPLAQSSRAEEREREVNPLASPATAAAAAAAIHPSYDANSL